jgi:hypothetical protein
MIDVNKITSTLAKLPDAQLQQYAQMHKNDPYIMALAMTESNRRKELRAASQGQAPQEQPKIVDQAVAEMAPQEMPEEMGIGRLPAGEMDFANGGIVAFADGGDIDYWSTKVDTDEGLRTAFRPTVRVGEEYTPGIFGSLFGYNVLPAKEQVKKDAAARTEPPKPITEPAKAAPQVAEEKAAPAPKAPSPSNMERAEALSSPTTIDALQQKYFGDFKSKQEGLNNKREGLVQGIKDLALANLEEDKKYAEERSSDKVYKGREERLAKQEKDLEGLDDRYLGLAMLQAGAAMMSTPGGIGAALGKGVSVGAERYAAGLDKINAAQAKFAEARDRLDELRINRDDMNAKQIRDSLRQVQASDLKGQEFLLGALEKDWGIERDMLGKVFTAANEDLQNTRRIAAQKATSGKQDTNEQMRAAVLADLQNKYPGDPTRVAAEFNKAFAKTEDLEAYYRKQQLDKLAEAKVKNAGMPGGGIPGQAEKLEAMEKQLIGGRAPAQTPTASHVDALKKNPTMAVEFDKKFGPGAAAQYLK